MYKITAFEKNLYSKCIPWASNEKALHRKILISIEPRFSAIFGGEQQNSTTNSTATAKTTNSKRFNFQLRQDSTAYDDNITDEYLNSTTLDAGDETAEDLLLSSEEDQLINNATATPLAAGDLYGTIYDVSGAYVLSSGTDNNFFLDDAVNSAAATQFIFSNYVTNEDEVGVYLHLPTNNDTEHFDVHRTETSSSTTPTKCEWRDIDKTNIRLLIAVPYTGTSSASADSEVQTTALFQWPRKSLIWCHTVGHVATGH
jgi:hypothetical protein